jgi:multicomponent Na+:H+ antiporter subunit E
VLTVSLLLAAWLGLVGGDLASLVIGLPAIGLGYFAACRAGARSVPIRIARLPGFCLGLLGEIATSGWRVARRVVAKEPGFAPAVQRYRVLLRSEAARATFMNAVTLTPGTLSAELRGDVLEVHALDGRANVATELGPLEAKIARLFDEPVGDGAAT